MKFKDIFSKHSSGLFNFESSILEKRAFSQSALFESALQISSSKSLSHNIREMFQKTESFSEKIGTHPDFENVPDAGELHYIVSVFVDIQGSTNLVFNYKLEQVRFIKDKILNSAIEIFQALDGHIHRLQGDAIFCYFGGKGIGKSDAVINALNACTLLQEYMGGHINPQFEEIGIEPIKIRIGIDLGFDDEVLWSKYGLKECCEITTTSLHTDLAAKLQGKCPVNSILIGENLHKQLDIPDDFLKIRTHIENGEKKEERYIVQRPDYLYRMYIFNWKEYLKSFEFTVDNSEMDNFSLTCRYKIESEDNYKEYISNSKALEKGLPLKFMIDGLISLKDYDFTWTVINHGEESKLDSSNETFVMDKYEGKIYCEQMTMYKGHHYMKCTIYKNGMKIGDKYFGIYVKDRN